MDQYFADLGAALRSMDIDTEATAFIRRKGPRSVSIQAVVPESAGKELVSANAEFYPDRTDYTDVSSFIPEVDMNDVGQKVSAVATQTSEFVQSAQGELAPSVNNVVQKFQALPTMSKLAVLALGYYAAKSLPSKYLWLAGGLLAYNQIKGQAAVAQSATEAQATTKPVAGMC